MKLHSLITSLLLSSISCDYIKIFDKSNDLIKLTTVKDHDQPYNINYLIQQPNGKVTTIRIIQLEFTGCNHAEKCCNKYHLSINENGKLHKFCHNRDQLKWLSLRSRTIEIKLQMEKGNANLWLEYKSRSASECPDHEFQCMDKISCYNSSEICDHRFACKDHSDEIGCADCGKHIVPCDTRSAICFDPVKQRCDRRLDCPRGEDEQGCSQHCNWTTIGCSSNSTCVTPLQLCDDKSDCPDGFDEVDCAKQYCTSPPYFLCNNGMCIEDTLLSNGVDDCGDMSDELNLFQHIHQVVKSCTIAASIMFLSILFTSLVVRWCTHRRDVQRMLLNLPEFPLPPFQGPGEHGQQESYNLGYSDSDFRVGGDVYEAFARIRRRIETDNKNIGNNVVPSRTHSGSANFSSIGGDGNVEIIEALVSLSLPYEMCIGLDRYIVEIMENSNAKQTRYIGDIPPKLEGTYSFLREGPTLRY